MATTEPSAGKPSKRTADGRPSSTDPLASLRRKTTLSAWSLSWERVWPRLALTLSIVGIFLGLAWLGILARLPDAARLAVVGALALLFLASVLRLALTPKARTGDAVRRLERDSGIAHRPLTALADARATGDGDAVSTALWEAHKRRVTATIDAIKVAPPSPRLDRRDPYVLRAAVFLFVVVGLATAFRDPWSPLADAVRLPRALAPDVRIDAWVTPPAYTRRAPVFLTSLPADAPAISVPAGSVVSVRVTGLEAPVASYRTSSDAAEPLPEGAPPSSASASTAPADAVTRPAAFEAPLAVSGTLEIGAAEGQPLRSFAITVTPDAAPVVRLAEEPAATQRGAFRLAYEISDDYRVSGAKAVFSNPSDSTARAEARPLIGPPDMPLVLPRRTATSPKAETFRDLSAHPWAGGVVKMQLEARDDAGNVGTSETIDVIIPARPFGQPLARMLVEQRRNLALDALAAPAVADVIDTVSLHAPTFVDDASVALGLRVVRNRILDARSDDDLRAVLDLMWQMALAIDGGDASLAEQRLREARDALREALRNGASQEEIARLTDELRKAMDEYMKALAEQMRDNPNLSQQLSPQDMQQMQEISPEDFQKMIDRMEQLSELGDREAAEQLLSELDRMLENLQTAQPRQSQQGQQGQQGEMNQMMNELADMIRRQQELMNETFQMSPDGSPQSEGQQGQGEPMTPGQMAEAMKRLQEGQGQLQQRLEQMMKQLQQGGMDPGEELGEAGKSMGEAEGSLGEGEAGQALGQQGRALEQLRQGAQQLAEQMQGQGEGEGPGQRGRTAYSEDPLGRPQRRDGPDFGDSVKVPGEIDVQRARRILEELRRRFSDETRPTIELDYLRRLLTPF